MGVDDMKKIAIIVAGVAVTGCSTTLHTVPVSTAVDRIDGAPYALPRLEMTLTTTRRLIDCKSVSQGGVTTLNPKFAFELKIKDDYPAAEWFTMDYSSLAGPTRTSSFSYELYDSKVIKSVNVEVDDKSVEIAGQVVKAGFGIARLATGLDLAGAAFGRVATCPTSLIDQRNAALKQKKTDSGNLEKMRARIAVLNLRGAAGPLGKKDKKDLQDLIEAADKLVKDMEAQDKNLAETDKILALAETTTWRPDPATVINGEILWTQSFAVVPPAGSGALGAARSAWLEGLFGVPASDIASDLGFKADLEKALALTAHLQIDGGTVDPANTRKRLGITTGAPTPKSAKAIAGVVARLPMKANARFCAGTEPGCGHGAAPVLAESVVSVPQLAPYVVLRFHNGLGENNILKAEFDLMGSPTKVTFDSKRAVALEVAKTVNSGIEQGIGFANDRRAQKKAETEAAATKAKAALDEPNAALKRDLEALQTQQQITAIQTKQDPTNAAAAAALQQLKDEVERLKYEIEKKNALETLGRTS
ncbi:hypothetical protein CAF53_12870 [Sphingobium sp. LB126]|nr:hypothetical protein CAF53_12870 [Sphingobium sp. LB126]